MNHKEVVAQSFGSNAQAYLQSAVHSAGDDLKRAAQIVSALPDARAVDLGCGAGHLTYAVAPFAKSVIAYDLSPEMLSVVHGEAEHRGLKNIQTECGSTEDLPFSDGSVDAVISRYSAHHWRDVRKAMREVSRILRPGGIVCFIDVVGGSEPLFDTYIQALELLRDPSHVRDYTEAEWIAFCSKAGIDAAIDNRWRLPIQFSAWIERIGTPSSHVAAIRALWSTAPVEVREHYGLQADLSFELDALMLVGTKRGA